MWLLYLAGIADNVRTGGGIMLGLLTVVIVALIAATIAERDYRRQHIVRILRYAIAAFIVIAGVAVLMPSSDILLEMSAIAQTQQGE